MKGRIFLISIFVLVLCLLVGVAFTGNFIFNFGKSAAYSVPGYPLCKEVISGHNNYSESRVNWVFVGYDFRNKEFMRKTILDAVDFSSGSSRYSLLNIAPFNNSRDKINVWYVDKIGSHSDMMSVIKMNSPSVGTDSVLRLCPSFSNEYVVIFQDSYNIKLMLDTVFHSAYFGDDSTTAGIASIGRGYIWMFSNYPFALEQQEAMRHYLVHEWGHIFGGLFDDYVNTEVVNFPSYESDFNKSHMISTNENRSFSVCDCEAYMSYPDILSYSCEKYSLADCNSQKMNLKPCFWKDNQCINVAAYCGSFLDSASCTNASSCAWINSNLNQVGVWNTKNCIPVSSNMAINDVVKSNAQDVYVQKYFPAINVGINCTDGDCIMGANYLPVSFRREPYTVMRQDFSLSYGDELYNSIIVDKISQIVSGKVVYGGFWEYMNSVASQAPVKEKSLEKDDAMRDMFRQYVAKYNSS